MQAIREAYPAAPTVETNGVFWRGRILVSARRMGDYYEGKLPHPNHIIMAAKTDEL